MRTFLLGLVSLALLQMPCPGPVIMRVGSGPDVTAPELASATIDGDQLVLNFSEVVDDGTGWDLTDLDLDYQTSGSNVNPSSIAGDGTATWTLTMATAITAGETVNLDFNGDADSIEDNAGNDLASITDGTVTNNTSASYSEEDLFTDAGTSYYQIANSGPTLWRANAFQTGPTNGDGSSGAYDLERVRVWLYRANGDPPGNLVCHIFATSSDLPDGTSAPGGSGMLGTSTAVDASTITATALPGDAIDFDFGTPVSLSADTIYWIVITNDAGDDGTNYVNWARASSDEAYLGNQVAQNNADDTTWVATSTTNRLRFTTYSTP